MAPQTCLNNQVGLQHHRASRPGEMGVILYAPHHEATQHQLWQRPINRWLWFASRSSLAFTWMITLRTFTASHGVWRSHAENYWISRVDTFTPLMTI